MPPMPFGVDLQNSSIHEHADSYRRVKVIVPQVSDDWCLNFSEN